MLSISTKPKNYELLSSWLLRITHLNGTDVSTFSNKIFSNQKLLINDIDKFITTKELKEISRYLDINIKLIEKLPLNYYLPNFSTQELKVNSKWQGVIPSGSKYKLKTNGLQFCSQCLKDKENTFYIFNRLSWNIICSKHQILLQTNCPNCNYQFSPILKEFDKPIYLCNNCGYDLPSSIPINDISNEALELQNFLNSCLKENKIIVSNYQLKDKNLYELFYTVRTILNFLLSIQKNKRIINIMKDEFQFADNLFFKNKPTIYFDILEQKQRMYLMHMTSKLLKTNLNYFEQFLNHSKITYKQLTSSNNEIPKSPTIKYLSRNLKIINETQTSKKSNKIIAPKSKDEIDKLMYEIEEYLK